MYISSELSKYVGSQVKIVNFLFQEETPQGFFEDAGLG